MKKTFSFLALLWACLTPVFAQSLQLTDDAAAFPLKTESNSAYMLIDQADAQVVGTVANCLRSDIALVTESNDSIEILTKPKTGAEYAVVAGTIGQSAYIDQLVSNGKINADDIAGKWEAYMLQTVENPFEGVKKAIVIAGSNPRGTAYGIFHLSRIIGVHPWYWWADIKPENHAQLFISDGTYVSKEPSVRYRGIFINDEDWGIYQWAKATIDTKAGSIGPNTYEKVMELILRMKANLLWPAMHECLGAKTFWYWNECHELARKWNVVMGSSHCDVMLRCNNSDWLKWNGFSKDAYNYATNKSVVQKYWAERAGQSRDIDAIYTIGMRGVHDSGIQGYSSTADKVRGLTDIITYQRQLIADSIASKRGTTVDQIPQTFIPYKEVLDAYNAGLNVPEDVILCWVDDNHGYIRQLSSEAEQKRKGGAGIYYHVSYYGSPHDYLWLSTISPSLISYELCKAYDMNTRDMWIINVGDIKPAEEEIQFAMDLAWDIDQWRPELAYDYTEQWASEIFGEQMGKEIAAIKNEYYKLAASGKPEHIAYVDYTEKEMQQRMDAYDELLTKVSALNAQMPPRLKYAFYQLVRYPVVAAANMNKKVFSAAMSFTHAAAGYDDATKLASAAKTAYNSIVNFTNFYNTGALNNENTSNPKWRDFMSYKPRVEGNSHFNMPAVATAADVAETIDSIVEAPMLIIPASDYSEADPRLKAIRGLGTSAQALGILPVTAKTFDVANAPKATYKVHLFKGKNNIELRMLPTFPINTAFNLRVAYKINSAEPKTVSFKTTATSAQWDLNVLRGYASVIEQYEAEEETDVTLTVYFIDPSVVLNDIKVQGVVGPVDDTANMEDVTSQIRNPQFSNDGNSKQTKKVPSEWSYTGNVNYSSISVGAKGANNEIAANQPHWQVWSGAGTMSQTISNLPEGYYTVKALIVATGTSSSTLFANDESTKITSAAGDFLVTVYLKEGEDLTIGIKKTESGSDIEVDDFRLYYRSPSTAINTPMTDSAAPLQVFAIDGRRISPEAPLAPGIYIINGKKVLVK